MLLRPHSFEECMHWKWEMRSKLRRISANETGLKNRLRESSGHDSGSAVRSGHNVKGSGVIKPIHRYNMYNYFTYVDHHDLIESNPRADKISCLDFLFGFPVWVSWVLSRFIRPFAFLPLLSSHFCPFHFCPPAAQSIFLYLYR